MSLPYGNSSKRVGNGDAESDDIKAYDEAVPHQYRMDADAALLCVQATEFLLHKNALQPFVSVHYSGAAKRLLLP